MATRDPAVLPKSKGKSYGFIFAVQEYLDSHLEDVTYAVNDGKEVAKVLAEIGCDPASLHASFNQEATKTTIEYRVRQLAKTATKDDTVFFFFSGHGLALDGHNYLLAHDSRSEDVENTAVPLHRLFDLFSKSACRRVIFFLDGCHVGMNFKEDDSGTIEPLSTAELREYFKKADLGVVFSACDQDEVSHPSHKFQHGYWTALLVKALRGQEPRLLDKEGWLRAAALQDYLRAEVPKQLALQASEDQHQNPQMYGNVAATFAVADLSPIVSKQKANLQLASVGLKTTTLRGDKAGLVKNLSGFVRSKGHKVPDHQSDRLQSWIQSLAEGDLAREMDRFFQEIQDSGTYTNETLKYDPASEGCSSIRTPDFQFFTSYAQSEEDPAEFVLTRELIKLRDPALLDAGWFNRTFGGIFDKAVFEFSDKLDVNAFINKAEKMDEFQVRFNGQRTECRIQTSSFEGTIVVTSTALIYEFRNTAAPKEIATKLQEIHPLFLGLPDMHVLLPGYGG